MHYIALVTDYDGTIAHDGVVDAPTIAALERLRSTGRKLILVTGREVDDLSLNMPRLDLFDLVVAENGALLYRPATGEERALAGPPPEAFVARLRALGVTPLSVGRCIVATTTRNESKVRAAIGDPDLGLRVILNKGSLMVLPAGVDKASGLGSALAELDISPATTVAVGDAENDLPFLLLCGMTVAVANAVPELRRAASLVTQGSRGAGVAELIDLWLSGGLVASDRARASLAPPAPRGGDAPPAPRGGDAPPGFAPLPWLESPR